MVAHRAFDFLPLHKTGHLFIHLLSREEMGITDMLKDFAEAKLYKSLRKMEGDFVHHVVGGIKATARSLMMQFVGMLIIVISFGLFTIAGIFFCVEYLELSKTLAFLIAGIIVLFIGLLMKVQR